jgi:hypothetical protein
VFSIVHYGSYSQEKGKVMVVGTVEIVEVEFAKGVIGVFTCFDNTHDGIYEVIEELTAVTVNGYLIEMPPCVRRINMRGVNARKVYEYALTVCDELRREVMAMPYTHME